MSRCIECDSHDTELRRGDDGHFRKECNDCGYVGGPYVSQQNRTSGDEPTETGQRSVLDY